MLHKAGVDTQFGAHSTRSASTSAAASKGLPIDIVLKAAGWSSASTFTRFYKREPVKKKHGTDDFGILFPSEIM